MNEGTVVVCGTGQVGTVISLNGDSVSVLLRNGEIWTGLAKQCHVPQSPEEIAAAPIEVERPETRKRRSRRDD